MRKCKGVRLLCEVLGEIGGKPTNYDRKYLERSSMCWKHNEKSNRIRESNGEKLAKVVTKCGIGLLHGYDTKK